MNYGYRCVRQCLLVLSLWLLPLSASAAEYWIVGVKISAGGRYDNVRMCVATPAGVPGGPAMDVSFFAEIGMSETMSMLVNVPVMRPILFAGAFQMLQFEPDVTLLFRRTSNGRVDLVAGPSVGVSMHYGPDYHSERDGSGRGTSFFAMGPRLGGYAGLDIRRPGETFNMQMGISPYVSPLFGIADPENHRGIVVGGSLDALLRFTVP